MGALKDKRLFEKIYNETYKSILKFVVYKCNDLNDVDDIIQDTYLQLFKELKNGKEILDKTAYLITIAKNKIISDYQSKIKIKTISIFQEKDEDEFTIELASRRRYRIRFYY